MKTGRTHQYRTRAAIKITLSKSEVWNSLSTGLCQRVSTRSFETKYKVCFIENLNKTGAKLDWPCHRAAMTQGKRKNVV